jgi:uncharacterized LabA/DUF88 family protein
MPEQRDVFAMAFFDGQNLYQHAKAAFGHHHPNYDPIKLHRAVCAANGWTANLIRFYSGVPSQAEAPMWAGYWSNRVLAMKRAGISVTTRPIRYRKEAVVDAAGTSKTITTPQEKGIDVRLALDIVKAARKREFDVAVIYSQDQDLFEVVAEVKEIAAEQKRKIVVACAFPDSATASSRRGIEQTQWIKLDQATYDACIDPHDYRPRRT